VVEELPSYQRNEMDEPERNVFYAWYPLCLNGHIRHNKPRFDCSRCARYRHLHLQPEEIFEDAPNCSQFLHELFFGNYSEEWELKQVRQGTVYVRVPLSLIQSFQNALFIFAAPTKALINIGNRIAQIADDLKCRIAAKGDDEQLEP
jgi:hypothetical protein